MGARNSGYDRDPLDWYVEPAWCVEQLFHAEGIQDCVVWDPACGRGTIIKVARAFGCFFRATDVIDRGCPKWIEYDFIKEAPEAHNSVDWIVTNPPFKNAVPFIKRALEYGCNVAVLVPLTFLASQKRKRELFDKHPPTAVWIMSKRPSMPPGKVLLEMEARGEEPGSGSIDFVWIVWCPHARTRVPEIGWLGDIHGEGSQN